MPQPLDDPALASFMIGTMVLSVAVGLFLLARRKSGPLLPYEPRRPVPWNAAAALLAVLFVLMALLSPSDIPAAPQQSEVSPALEDNSPQQNNEPDAAHGAMHLLAALVPEILLVGGTLFLIVAYFNATPRDFGLPADRGVFSHDVFVGIVAGVAALAPIHMLQLGLANLMRLNERSGHPLVKMLIEGQPDFATLLLATFAVVVVAPICEELAFRLLLQGWLEKWEVVQLGWRDEPSPGIGAGDEEQAPIVHVVASDGPTSVAESPDVSRHLSFDAPPPRGVAGWPFGWLPITISSLLFGLAHFGYGPEPIPLFFLGLVLGYVYQRTHRIVPCIAAHSLFNLFTVVVLWWMVFHGEK
jgi:membrane protease YdiL (CAAX protease family)